MIKTQIIKEGDDPIAVVIDYQEYIRLKALEEDMADYQSALQTKKKNKKWFKHDDLKKELGL